MPNTVLSLQVSHDFTELKTIPERMEHGYVIGTRVCYTIPERGGWGYGFGRVTKVNRKTVDVDVEKGRFAGDKYDGARVSKELIYKVVRGV